MDPTRREMIEALAVAGAAVTLSAAGPAKATLG